MLLLVAAGEWEIIESLSTVFAASKQYMFVDNSLVSNAET
jgi:hypothetical protein